MYYLILNTAALLMVASLPISLIVINIFTKLFSKIDPKLANTTTICTSVRGVLTNSTLNVRTLLVDKYKIQIEETNDLVRIYNEENKESQRLEKKQLPEIEGIQLISVITTLCHFEKLKKIEDIILNLFKNINISPFQIKKDFEIIGKIPQNKEKKISTTVAIKKATQEIFAFSKGHPRQILEKCTRILINNKKVELTYHLRRKLRKKIQKLNQHGEKVISFAYKGLPFKKLHHYSEKFAESDMTFIGLIGLSEDPNLNLIPIIEEAKKKNLKFYVLSHVKEREAVAAATDLKVINPFYFESITGDHLREFNEAKLIKILSNKEKDFVFSELKSSDKEKIIDALKKSGETIAVSQRNGQSIIEILNQIEKSKARKLNNDKLLFHSLSFKAALIVMILVNLVFNLSPGISISSILLIELIANIPLQLSLRHEKTEPAAHQGINKKNYIHILLNGSLAGLIVSGIYLLSLLSYGFVFFEENSVSNIAINTAQTLVLISLLTIQILNFYNARDLKNSIFKKSKLNKLEPHLVSLTVILLFYLVLKINNYHQYFQIQRVTISQIEAIIFFCSFIVFIEEIRKRLQKSQQNNEPKNT